LSKQKKGTGFLDADKSYIRSKGVRLGTGITGWVAEHGESVRLGDVSTDSRYLSLRKDVRSELCVPLRLQDQIIGVINVESTQANAYTEEDQQLLKTIAIQISVAIQNSRLVEDLRLSRQRLAELSRRLVEAYETERRAIGRELHDQFGQMLTAMKITLELARELPADAAAKRIGQAWDLTNDLLNRVSRLSLELRPSMLDDLGLIPALLWHVNNFQEQIGIQVDFKHSNVEGKRFTSGIETTAYRIAQEALTNVARHARATRAQLEVRAGGGWMEIRIEDDGVGFDPESALSENRGLSGMRERAQLVGGTFQIESERGKGTMIQIQLPLQEDRA
jgi:signal transduction histidine kinase